ncbi:hypothetical protein [Bacillus halotolerans]|uniref:hypothetical protein n=1 Tax=Bacillus halotolerans TaxID=260554 RepID=UPI00192B3032|nr:hypothetical protein [Bacillus halotolerans]MBL4968968.1 hypothetical protein [Bacillus halotolerans]MBL4973031.1 hypothetical protein [Bacillus halotolerans]MBL4978805.1 hypothetical protein [Bacillus halotolerans]
MDEFAHYKLKIDAKPSMFHGKTVRKNLTDTLWRKKIRVAILERKKHRCVICNYAPHINDLRRLHVHEVEEYDFENGVVKLLDLNLICVDCHSFQHFKRSQLVLTKDQLANLAKHFCNVNNCTMEDYEHYRQSLKEKRLNEMQEEISRELQFKKPLGKKQSTDIKFAILGDIPYKDLVIQRLKNKGVYYEYDNLQVKDKGLS